MSDTREEMQKQVGRNQMMLGGLAAIRLFVAALNIANTMTMAIYERTREIGVMKVLGCELKNIRRMFLIESGFIGFIGGVAGALLSWGVSFILNNLLVIASGVMMLLQSLGVQANLDLSFLMNSGMGTGSTMSIIPAVAGGRGTRLCHGDRHPFPALPPANRAVRHQRARSHSATSELRPKAFITVRKSPACAGRGFLAPKNFPAATGRGVHHI